MGNCFGDGGGRGRCLSVSGSGMGASSLSFLKGLKYYLFRINFANSGICAKIDLEGKQREGRNIGVRKHSVKS